MYETLMFFIVLKILFVVGFLIAVPFFCLDFFSPNASSQKMAAFNRNSLLHSLVCHGFLAQPESATL